MTEIDSDTYTHIHYSSSSHRPGPMIIWWISNGVLFPAYHRIDDPLLVIAHQHNLLLTRYVRLVHTSFFHSCYFIQFPVCSETNQTAFRTTFDSILDYKTLVVEYVFAKQCTEQDDKESGICLSYRDCLSKSSCSCHSNTSRTEHWFKAQVQNTLFVNAYLVTRRTHCRCYSM